MVGMVIPLATALVLSMTCQSPPTDRALAEQLARSGRTVEALAIFERIVAENPTDLEVRLWIARLQLRMGRPEEAEAGFRAVLLEHPSDVDARIGIGAALTRRDAWREALTVLHDAERDAGNNADLFAALARAYRRAGDDRRALDYYRRALAVAPGDPDVVEGYEAAVRAYGSSIVVEGFGEGGVSDARSVSLVASVRVLPRLEIEGRARVQNRNGSSDTLVGGGGIWRINRSTLLEARGEGGVGNTSLPNAGVMAEVRHYRGAIEIGGNVRHLSFSDVGVTAASPILAWDTGERWRLAARYTYSWSSFVATGESSGDHSVLLRETFRGWRRVDMTATYAYGIESFEDLTADRIGNLGANTIAATVRIRTPSLTSVATTWEHQWRFDDTRLDRLTVLVMQGFR
jgi:cytochrome c-type biogenesis protein CcmH/NrfG